MTAIKERLIGAITMMDDEKAQALWDMIVIHYAPKKWEDIPEEEPDAIDLQMLEEIDINPECHEFIKESDIDWT
mgnify:FL=1